jgi:hypothetical protein
MSTILEALAVIKGKDATGGAFDAVAQKIGRISRAANALNRDVQKQLNLAAGAERAASRMQRASSAIGTGAKMAAGAAAAYGGGRAVAALAHETVKAGSDRAHEEARMAASGMTVDEIKHANELAASISKKYPSVSNTEAMHAVRNIRSVTGHFEEATKILDPLMRLRVVALGAHPEKADELGEDFDKLIKGMEIKGVTQDLAKFNHYIDGMAKAVNVFGDTLRPTDYYEMFKYGRAATNALSDDFMLKTAPTLAQELGGSSAGKALSSFYTQFVGGKMSNKALAQLEEYGLLTDPSKVIKTSTGNVKGILPGAIMGQEYLQPGATDPYAWVNKVLIPQLAKKGVTDPAKIQEVIAAMASQQTTAQMMSIFATQQARIEKDKHLVEGAKGVEAAELFQQSDPKVIRKSIEAQVDNVLGNAASAFQPGVNKSMNWLTSGLSYMSERAQKDPMRTAAELGFGAGLASAISADSTMGIAGKFGIGSGSLGLTRLMGLLAPILDIATRKDVIEATPALKALAGLHGDKFDALRDLDASERAADVYGHDDPTYDAQLKALNDAKRAKIEAELAGLGYGPAGLPGRGQMASQWTVADIQKATGIGGGSGEPVKAEVVGNATLETTVKVEPAAGFWAQVDQRIQNGINAFRSSGAPASGSSGSTGRSMPEAGPPP